MSMKRFFKKGSGDNDEQSLSSSPKDQSLRSGSLTDSFDDLRPMFGDAGHENDSDLNINPSISNNPPGSQSILTKDSDNFSNSVFSQSKKTFSTNQSSYKSQDSKTKVSNSSKSFNNFDYGQPLQILDIPEESNEDYNFQELMIEKLHTLYQDISFIINQYDNSSINLSSAVINIIDCLKKLSSFIDGLSEVEEMNFSTYNNDDLRKIMKIFLHFYDHLLNDEVYVKLKLLLVKNFNDVTSKLNIHYKHLTSSNQSLLKPKNFAVGANSGESLPNEDILSKIIYRMSNADSNNQPLFDIKEQNGSFIAPVVRGLSKDLNVLCLYFGFPNPSDYHYKLTKNLTELYDDVHVLVLKNNISLATSVQSSLPNFNQQQQHHHHHQNLKQSSTPRFKLPFRNPSDSLHPPMSLSLSVETSARTSGTMGGFIYPKIDLQKQPKLASYANSKFAISCGHVCLDKKEDNIEYPHVSSPLAVLVNLYKQALKNQYQKFSANDDITMKEARNAYGSALNQLDDNFPLRKIKVHDSKSKQDRFEIRNFPKHRFGQIIWGERTLINARKLKDGTKLEEKRLSDLAIIKVNKALNCDLNFLGDDIAFNEFDPSLMFDNLYVRKIVNLNRTQREFNMDNLNDVDSSVSSFNSQTNYGIPVFKYGSTTKFTQGNLNGIKMVYWLDGAIHSSEFVVNSIDKNSAFAAGGDSGSWILSKLEDVPSVSENKGLGVLGMLHSYDGEFKQFGLFTPMHEILDRLQEVTKIEWGVVGVNEKHDDESIASVDSDEDTGFASGSDAEDDDYESGMEDFDGSNPPDVD